MRCGGLIAPKRDTTERFLDDDSRVTRVLLSVAIAATVVAAPVRAPAQPAELDDGLPGEANEPLPASAVADAPRPHQARNYRVEPEGESWLWWIPRVALFVPRYALEVVFAPIRLGFYALGAYDLEARFEQIFFNTEGTLGLFPVLFYESGFGLHAGARFLHRDLYGKGGRLNLRAGFGGRERLVASAGTSTGTLLGDRIEVSAGASYASLDRARFFGYGGADAAVAAPPLAVDPRVDDTAVDTRFEMEEAAVEVAGAGVWGPLALSLSSGYRFVDFREPDAEDPSLTGVYDPATVPGYEAGLTTLYGGAEVVFDTRRTILPHLPTIVPSIGWRLAGSARYHHGLGDDPSRFTALEVDVQRWQNLYGGDRVLILRGLYRTAVGDLDDIPFIDLPTLGGSTLLRGHSFDRFRDRIAGMVSAEYDYPIARFAIGFLFVDAGRVWRSLSDIDADGLRVGFGGGFQFHSGASFLGRLTFATSKDGGFFFNLSFDPVYDPRKAHDS